MRAAWAPFAGTRQPVAVLCEIRDAAATILRNKGYLAAVQVPTQRIENGVVQMETLFARVTTVRARGQTGGAEAKLAAYLGKLTEDEIFDRNRAERYLLLARDLPGYNVQLTLKPAGTAPGELIGEVSVLRRPYSVDATVQNLAAKETGRWGGQLRAQRLRPDRPWRRHQRRFYSTVDFKEQKILQLSHSFRPGSEGLIDRRPVHLCLDQARPRRAATRRRTSRRGPCSATLGARYPLIRTPDAESVARRRLRLCRPEGRFLRAADRATSCGSLWLRADWDAVDLSSRRPRWRAARLLELRHGLDIFDASDGCRDRLPRRRDGRAGSTAMPTATVIRAAGRASWRSAGFRARGRPARPVWLRPAARRSRNSPPAIIPSAAAMTRRRSPATAAPACRSSCAARADPAQVASLALQPYLFGDAAWVWNKNDGERRRSI